MDKDYNTRVFYKIFLKTDTKQEIKQKLKTDIQEMTHYQEPESKFITTMTQTKP